MTHLAQIQNLDYGPLSENYWYTAHDLNLGGAWSEIWTSYTKGLLHGGIRINNTKDSMIWMQNTKNGSVTAKKAYDLIVSYNLPLSCHNLHSQLWHPTEDKKLHMAGH